MIKLTETQNDIIIRYLKEGYKVKAMVFLRNDMDFKISISDTIKAIKRVEKDLNG